MCPADFSEPASFAVCRYRGGLLSLTRPLVLSGPERWPDSLLFGACDIGHVKARDTTHPEICGGLGVRATSIIELEILCLLHDLRGDCRRFRTWNAKNHSNQFRASVSGRGPGWPGLDLLWCLAFRKRSTRAIWKSREGSS